MADRPQAESSESKQAPAKSPQWRGKQTEHSRVARHRWQRDWIAQPLQTSRVRDQWRRMRVCGWLLVGLLLLAAFIHFVLFTPVQTPFLALAPTAYEWPFPPNAWAAETIDGFADMDGQTLRLVDLSAAWRSKNAGLRDLDRQLRDVAHHRHHGTLILYINMHGVTDEWGHPCLIPTDGSSMNSDSWIHLSEVLDQIRECTPVKDLKKLLILDCMAVTSNWNTGVLYNGFSEQLPEVIEAAHVPNLAVLSAAGSGQRSWTSADLQGTVFGYFLHRALAGAADVTMNGGNGDQQLSVHELAEYLKDRVSKWVAENRGAVQIPRLIPATTPDFAVCYSTNRSSRNRLLARLDNQVRSAPAVTPEEIYTLWNQLETARSWSPYRFNPLTWRNLEHRLLWLEQCARSGRAYAGQAHQLQTSLAHDFEQIQQRRAQQPATTTSLTTNLFSSNDIRLPDRIRMHCIPLAERFQQLTPTAANELRAIFERFRDAPTSESLTLALNYLGRSKLTEPLVESHLLKLLQQYQVPELWNQGDIIGNAIELQATGEACAVPNDERALRWVRKFLTEADHLRNRYTDQLFGGTIVEPEDTPRARQEYRKATAVTTAVSDALQVRDLLWGELGYLAQWMMRPQRVATAAAAGEQQLNDQLLLLIDNSHLLGRMLGDRSAEDNQPELTALPFADRLADTRQQYARFRQLFDVEYARLLQIKEPDTADLQDMYALLAVPLLPRKQTTTGLMPAQQRQRLIELVIQVESRLRLGGKQQSKSDDQQPAEPEAESIDYLDWLITHWSRHPALALLSRQQLEVNLKASTRPHDLDPLTLTATEGQRVRELLRTIGPQVQAYRDQKADRPELLRDGLSRADRLVRAAAPFYFRPIDEDPTALLRQFDLQRMLLWHCQRTLDDFWGPTRGETTPFFITAAQDYLQVAASLQQSNPSTQWQLEELARLLDSRRKATTTGLQTTADNLLLVDQADAVSTTVTIHAGSDVKSLPDGYATVFLEDGQGIISGALHPRELPLQTVDTATGEEVKFDLPPGRFAGRGPDMRAVTLFRGNRFPAPFVLSLAGGIAIDYRPQVYQSSQVLLKGRQRKPASVVVILDCSHSLSEEMEVEGARGKLTRLEVARMALGSMLDRLATDSDTRVGVLCFGHRLAWNLKQPTQLLQQHTYAGPIPDDLKPFDDVEVVLPLGRFDPSLAAKVTEQLATTLPWGESPIYLSLVQALQQFSNEPPDSEQSIILITDGVNYQFNPNAASRKTADDVLAARGKQAISINIVGFGIPSENKAEADREFGRIAKETSGQYFNVNEARALVDSLENLRGPGVWHLRETGGADRHANVGTSIIVRPPPAVPTGFIAAFDRLSQSIELAGGEALELQISRDRERLESVRYELNSPRFLPLIQFSQQGPQLTPQPASVAEPQQESTGVILGIHRPTRLREGVQFEVSIQREDQAVLPRPAEVWLEISPVIPAGRTAPGNSIFYDANYEPKTPVPVLKWLSPAWPADARQARVQFWCKSQPTLPLIEVPIGPTMTRAAAHTIAIPQLPGVSYQIRQQIGDEFQVGVVERHSVDSGGVDQVKVGLNCAVQPLRIVHRFDHHNRLVLHTFYFRKADAELAAKGTVRFWSRADLQKGAWRLEIPAVIDIASPGELIDSSPAGG